MRRSVAPLTAAAATLLTLAGCRSAPPPQPPLVAQSTGEIAIDGLAQAVRVVRDRFGVPHIYAQSQDDLFIAQGFVQAQDRLFQMDLWRRSVQGRVSEVLGPNFIDRDAMTRRVQYRGDVEADWASYGPDTKAIASAFVRGINAWVALARDRPPEEFVAAGWKPSFWSAVDLLNRTESFVDSGDALEDVRRAKMSDVIADALRSVGAPPFFAGSARVAPELTRLAADGRVAATGTTLSVSEAGRSFAHPSTRYFVHLHAPGWNVVGGTAPWRPGVAIGHNESIAWGLTPLDADTQEILVEDASSRRVVKEPIVVKRRDMPFIFDMEMTPNGVAVAADRERGRLFTLRWVGTEPGGAPELASLALDRATDPAAFRAAAARWKLPVRRITFLDREGRAGSLDTIRAARPRRTDAGDAPVGTQAVFAHPLATVAFRQARFSIGPLTRPAADQSPVRAAFDAADWDRSRAMNAPGQSGTPGTDHFSDLAMRWSAGEWFPLPFSDAAVQREAKATLTLIPR